MYPQRKVCQVSVWTAVFDHVLNYPKNLHAPNCISRADKLHIPLNTYQQCPLFSPYLFETKTVYTLLWGGRNYSRKVCALATQNAFTSKRTADGSVRVQLQQRYLEKSAISLKEQQINIVYGHNKSMHTCRTAPTPCRDKRNSAFYMAGNSNGRKGVNIF